MPSRRNLSQNAGWALPRKSVYWINTSFRLRREIQVAWVKGKLFLVSLLQTGGTDNMIYISMTYSWLYTVIGTVVRKFELELHKTDEKNVHIVRDCFNGQTAPGLNVINVKVVKEFN